MIAKSIPPLTGIRGVAAVLVLLHHLPSVGPQPLIRNGLYGVDLFFILSGFILYHVHGAQFARPTWSETRAFFLSRFLRVYPLHFVVLMAILGLVLVFPDFRLWMRAGVGGGGNAFSTAGFMQTLTLTNRVGLPNFGDWNGPSWSLSSEVVGYLLFPLLAAGIMRVQRVSICFAYSLGSVALHCLAMYTDHHGVVRVLLTFPVGMALAKAAHLSAPSERSVGAAAAFAAAWIIVTLSIDILAPLSTFGFMVLVYVLAFDRGGVARALSSRPIMFLGIISFSLYLTHWIVLLFATWISSGRMQPAVLLVMALLVGWATYHLIEAPSHRLGRRLAAASKHRAPEVVRAA